MRKLAIMFMIAMLIMTSLTGCRANVPQDTTGQIMPSSTAPSTSTTAPSSTAPSGTQNGNTDNATESVQILSAIWNQYGEGDKFAAYGGAVDNAVDNAPGALNMSDSEELTTRYLIPQDQLTAIRAGASLVHMMNNNIFTGVVVTLSENGDMKALYEAWRDTIQGNRWICGQPDRLLMASVDDTHLVMAFGSTEAMNTFTGKLSAAHSSAKVLYNEAVVS